MQITRKGVADASFSLGGMALTVMIGTGLSHGDSFLHALLPGLAISLPFMVLYAVCSMPEDLRSMRKALPFSLCTTAVALLWCCAIRKMADQNGLVGEARVYFAAKLVLILIPFVLIMLGAKLWLESRKGEAINLSEN